MLPDVWICHWQPTPSRRSLAIRPCLRFDFGREVRWVFWDDVNAKIGRWVNLDAMHRIVYTPPTQRRSFNREWEDGDIRILVGTCVGMQMVRACGAESSRSVVALFPIVPRSCADDCSDVTSQRCCEVGTKYSMRRHALRFVAPSPRPCRHRYTQTHAGRQPYRH